MGDWKMPQDLFVNEGEGKEYVQMGFREAAGYFFFARPYESLGAWNEASEAEHKRAVSQANHADNLTEGWLLRKFADSSNGSDKVEKAVRLAKHMGRSPTEELLSNIS